MYDVFGKLWCEVYFVVVFKYLVIVFKWFWCIVYCVDEFILGVLMCKVNWISCVLVRVCVLGKGSVFIIVSRISVWWDVYWFWFNIVGWYLLIYMVVVL